ncbi:hypothetical protein AWB67_01055 [Caballeronia terrestris]|jgi:hypothetical protein|uniref:Lipoprotein n=1 Tax=Caballeronia terrestris TaxID=1226301 RepID=A0A158G2J5_9BURK|nr:hypothetical protein [Caballeronia terrestris]SAL26097.1 hypothetical protein AWB67_01055 [Caballeronia terrestris]
MRIAAAIAFGIFTMSALSANADESSGSQWRFTETTLFELIQNGYSIVAVTRDAARAGSSSAEDTFFLQKTNSVYKCFENHAVDASAKRPSAPVECYELTKPSVTTK